jgi:hypothetical protein
MVRIQDQVSAVKVASPDSELGAVGAASYIMARPIHTNSDGLRKEREAISSLDSLSAATATICA